jgi:hypothetical protein
LPAVPPTKPLYVLVALPRSALVAPDAVLLPPEAALLLELLLLELLPQAATNRLSPIVAAASAGLMLRPVMSPLLSSELASADNCIQLPYANQPSALGSRRAILRYPRCIQFAVVTVNA